MPVGLQLIQNWSIESLAQEEDEVSAEASGESYSKSAAQALANETQGDSLLLLPLGHGGVVAGVLTYLHYRAMCGSIG